MNFTWKIVRVFISSTFKDMQAERDWLVRFVFPKLREDLVRYRIHFVDVDLRWGVTTDQDSLGVCREVIDECHPRFICILGGRYGWVPEGQDRSITADEINYGVLGREAAKRGHAFFYFREDSATARMVEETTGDFREPEGSESSRKLAALKQAIVDAGLPVFIYDSQWDAAQKRLMALEAFGNKVRADLLESLKNDAELAGRFTADSTAPPDEFAEEADQMDAFIEERTERFVVGSREPLMRDMITFAAADGAPNIFVVTGDPGSGKSAFLAKFTRELAAKPFANRHPSFVVPHFIGASTGSTDLRRTLRRLCHELARAAGNTEPLPLDIKELIAHFQKLLTEAGAKRHIILVVDALNQFDTTDGGHRLNWLPRELPPGVRIVASVIAPADRQPEHQTLAILRARVGTRIVKLEPLSWRDSVRIMRAYLRRFSKRMDKAQKRALLDKPATHFPLYLLTALEELRTLGTYEEITEHIHTLPGDARALFGWILTERLARDPGFRDREGRPCCATLVEKFAACLGVSRYGLSPAELTALLDPSDPLGNVAALLRLLRPYLMRRGELLDFYHSQFREAAKHSFLKSERKRCEAHQHLWKYFWPKADPRGDRSWTGSEPRPLCEISFHATCAAITDRNWDAPVGLLCDLRFVEARCRVGQVFELIADYRLTQEKLPEAQTDLHEESAQADRVSRWMAQMVVYSHTSTSQFLRIGSDETIPEPSARLPEPLATCRIESDAEITAEYERITTKPLRRDRLNKFADFVNSACHSFSRFGRREGFVLQQALAEAPVGPVHDAGIALQLPSNVPIFLRCWPGDARLTPRPRASRTLQHDSYTTDSKGRYAPAVEALRITPDGRLALSATPYGGSATRFCLWDLQSGECLRMFDDDQTMIDILVLSIDGKRAVTGKRQGSGLKVWNLETGVCTKIVRIDSVLHFSLDARLTTTLDADGNVELWALEQDKRIHTFKKGISPCRLFGTELVNCHDGTACHLDYVHTVTPDGRLGIHLDFLSDSIRVLQMKDNCCLREIRTPLGLRAAAWISADGRRLVSSSGNDTFITVWDIEKGSAFHLDGSHLGAVNTVSISSHGLLAVTGGEDGHLRTWDLKRRCSMKVLEGHKGPVTSVQIDTDGVRAVSGGEDESVRIWNLTTCKCLHVLQGHWGAVRSVILTPDGKSAISGSRDTTIRVWDVESGNCNHVINEHERSVTCLALMPNRESFISGSEDESLRLWDLISGRCLGKARCQGAGMMRSIAVTPDGESVFVSYWTLVVRRSIARYGSFFPSSIPLGHLEHENVVSGIAISPDGQWMVSGSIDRTIRFWRGGVCEAIFATPSGVTAIAVSPPIVVIGQESGEVAFLEMRGFPGLQPPFFEGLTPRHFKPSCPNEK
jgi:WD40 repeat protein